MKTGIVGYRNTAKSKYFNAVHFSASPIAGLVYTACGQVFDSNYVVHSGKVTCKRCLKKAQKEDPAT